MRCTLLSQPSSVLVHIHQGETNSELLEGKQNIVFHLEVLCLELLAPVRWVISLRIGVIEYDVLSGEKGEKTCSINTGLVTSCLPELRHEPENCDVSMMLFQRIPSLRNHLAVFLCLQWLHIIHSAFPEAEGEQHYVEQSAFFHSW